MPKIAGSFMPLSDTRILRYCNDMDEASFLSNAMVQDAVIRNLEIIGEASRNIERVAP